MTRSESMTAHWQDPAVRARRREGELNTWDWTIAVANVCKYHDELHMGRPASSSRSEHLPTRYPRGRDAS